MEKEITKNHNIELSQKNDAGEKEQLSDGYFSIDRNQIDELLTAYEQRTNYEELDKIRALGSDQGICQSLKSNFQNGISEEPEELARREKNFGSNKLEEEELKNCCVFVWEALGDMMLQILIVAAIVQTVLGATVSHEPSKDWIDGMSIILAVIVVVSVGSITNYQKEKKFKQLNDTNSEMTKFVITRNGLSKQVVTGDIYVGDIVDIGLGMILPADGIMISGSSVKIDESPLTGESNLIHKEPLENCMRRMEVHMGTGKPFKKHTLPSPLLFSGTMVNDGKGKYLVIAVGKYSQKGKIRELVKQSQEADDSKTPLEEKLDDIAEQVGYFGLVAAIVTLIALFVRFGVDFPPKESNYHRKNQTIHFLKSLDNNYPAIENNRDINNTIHLRLQESKVSGQILEIILLCVAIVVVAIPEGLPLAVTLSLAFSIGKMMKENNLVRKMQACETMGGANYICSDKTGTLTKNIMSVVSIFDCKDIHETEDITKDLNKRVNPNSYFANPEYYKLLKLSIILNLDATINEGDIITKANKSDQGFIDIFQIFGENLYNIRRQYLGDDLRVLSFNSDRKRMSAVCRSSEFPTGYRLFIKGASDILLEKYTTHYIDPTRNQQTILSDIEKSNFEGIVKGFGSKTLRTIVICYKDISEEEYNNYLDLDENGDYRIEKGGLTMISIVGIRDTLRQGVPEAVLKCQRAGITVVMVTGDLKDTAVAIAKQCNIINKNEASEGRNVALTGEDFYARIGGLECETCGKKVEVCECPKTKSQAKARNIDEDLIRKDKIGNMNEFKTIVSELRVVARSRPMDKYALVVGLKKLKNVVAVTGDGTNDAPALSKSDVGFAMGIQGTDIAKDASDIIILDDNFSSIVTAVMWGRNIFDNIRKFIQFQLTVNVCACILVFITACIGNETPLTPIQMLWVNMIMDSLGSLALATEPPHENLLDRKPYRRKERIINYKMWKHILTQAFFQLILLLFLYLYAPYFIEEDESSRMSDIYIINKCFKGGVPGKQPEIVNGRWKYYIIHGSSSQWSNDRKFNSIYSNLDCGNYAKYQDLSFAFSNFLSANGGTTHMTMIFNTFVFYTLFNQVNARVIDDNFNIFYRIHMNLLFILIIGVEMAFQVIVVEYTSKAFKVVRLGLTGSQWGLTFAFGAVTFPVSVLAKLLPLEGCLESLINCLTCEKSKSKNKVANVNDPPEEVEKENKGDVQLNLNEEENNQIKRDTSSKKREGGIINQIVKSRSKGGISKGGSHHSLRHNKE